jgi:hypothetical protein
MFQVQLNFWSESIECFPGIASRFFLKLFVTIPVTPIVAGTIVRLQFHIRFISVPKLLYCKFFPASFCTTFLSVGIAKSVSVLVFSFTFLIITSGLFAVTYFFMQEDITKDVYFFNGTNISKLTTIFQKNVFPPCTQKKV